MGRKCDEIRRAGVTEWGGGVGWAGFERRWACSVAQLPQYRRVVPHHQRNAGWDILQAVRLVKCPKDSPYRSR